MSIASEITRLQGAKADLATAIEGKGVTVPSATKLNGYADLVDAISQGGGGGTMQSKSVSYTPSTSAQSQTVTADAGYDGLSSVAVSVAAMPSGTEGTPTATKGTVSNHSIAVTPSVTNSAGYIEGGTKTGTAVTVSASDVTSGYQIKTANGTYDVTNLASLIVNVPNSYSASDEGKVVSNGALVAQTSDTVTTNDTYDTTLINSLTVNVSGGGGGDICDPDYPSGAVSTTVTALEAYALANRTGITSLSAPNALRFDSNSFVGCSALTSVYLPNANPNSGAGAYAFSGCSNLLGVALPSMTRNIYNYAFQNCSKLAYFDSPTDAISQQRAFSGCTVLTMVVLRKTGGAVTLSNINNFENTPFASGKSGGTLYVPSSLLSTYQSASNWSTILGYANNQIKSIESTHTDPTAPIDLTLYYADGTPIT